VNTETGSDCRSPVVFSARPRIELSPLPTIYRKASVGAEELLFDPRHPLKTVMIKNEAVIARALIRCFLILSNRSAV
jgi:hypothetical protein